MKKIIYITFLAISASLAFASCTEEVVSPNSKQGSGAVGMPDKGGN